MGEGVLVLTKKQEMRRFSPKNDKIEQKSAKSSDPVSFQHRLRTLDIKLTKCYHILSRVED